MYVSDNKLILLDKNGDYSLSPMDYENIFCDERYLKNFIKKDNIIYHVRNTHLTNCLINEVICEEIAKYFKVQTVDSLPALYNDNMVLLTKLFTNKKQKIGYITNFNTHFSLDIENLKKLDSYSFDEKNYITLNNESRKKIIDDLKKMIICDFITSQVDRHENNFMFEFNNDKATLLPLYDYEFSFFTKYHDNENYFQFDLDKKNILSFIRHDISFQKLLKNAMKLDMSVVNSQLVKKGICLSYEEIITYSELINNRKEIIKEKRLIK